MSQNKIKINFESAFPKSLRIIMPNSLKHLPNSLKHLQDSTDKIIMLELSLNEI